MPTESAFLLAALFLLLAASGWAMGRFGERDDDYPAGFPDLVESSGCSGMCLGLGTETETTALYACSLGGSRPSRSVVVMRPYSLAGTTCDHQLRQ